MDIIERFIKEQMEDCKSEEEEADKLRRKFVSDYPVNSIQYLSMDDFILGVDHRTFCNRIRYEMQVLASMGDAFPATFGIYYKKDEGIKLSKTYKKYYDDNITEAFEAIKKEIVRVLKSAEEDDFSFFDSCSLNSSFICKLIITYYPQKVFPVCTRSALKNYCRVLGMHYDEKENILITMQELLDWKKNLGEIASWSNYLYMRFGDWLWDSDKTISSIKIKKYRFDEVIRIEENVSDIGLIGSDKEVVIKQRVNQSVFREILLDKYHKCCLCGVSDIRLLIASHIKPWSVADPEERVDIDNGFIMCPNHDKAFDKGLISFGDDGSIIISNKVDSVNRVFLNLQDDMVIKLTEGNKKYLRYHRENIYDKSYEENDIEV